MTLFLLLRHAAHDDVGSFLAGRTPGILLGQAGRAQAGRLAERLKRERLAALYCSPRERTRQTADAIAAAGAAEAPQVLDALDEIDFGGWSGKSFAELDADETWRAWNARRSEAVTPGGESFADVARRIVGTMERLAGRHAGAAIGLVTHADVIKAAVLHHLGLAADDWWRIEVSPASITRLVLAGHGAQLLGLNEVIH
ncbi:histidine phosphatase family protein [Bosea sp. CS1GBMeth4]|uniref:histidine phosphatase family protein n=1 Tax=Bosea sp. CS1GBMeth4 TaxID=1892849 RepID=UPI001FCF0823|nr:histidine phosphatase family protein [Bosea sp. CS1GBMeth4]